MSRQDVAVARLTLSRTRLRLSMIEDDGKFGRVAAMLDLVQRHPVISAALAALAGAVITTARPWRWLLEPRLWSALLPSMLSVLAGVPVGGWVDVLAQLLRQGTAQAPSSKPESSPGKPS